MDHSSNTQYVSKSAGILLHHARESKGLSPRTAAQRLGLLVSHVRAIEDNRWLATYDDDTLLEYIQSYADLVGLDSFKIRDLYIRTARHSTQCAVPHAVSARPATKHRYRDYCAAIALVLAGMSMWTLSVASGGQHITPPAALNEGIDKISVPASELPDERLDDSTQS